MKRYLYIVIGLLFSIGLCNVSLADEDQKALSGEVTIGAGVMLENLDDPSITPKALRDRTSPSSFSVGKAPGAKGGAEYLDSADNDLFPVTGLKLDFRNKDISLDANGRFETSHDQDYSLNGAIKRIFLFGTNYNEFTHRTDHDYMENLNAHIFRDGPDSNGDPVGLPFAAGSAGALLNPDFYNTNNIPANARTIGAANVYNTDWNESARYYTNRSEWNNAIKFNIPDLPGLKIGFDHRQEKREGCKQAMTMSKCSGCHIESYSKGLNETTNDYVPKVSFQTGGLNLEYSWLHREFKDDSQNMMNGYNKLAEAHSGFAPLLQFTGATNPLLPFNSVPDSIKDSHNIRMRYDINEYNTLTGGIVYSNIRNTSTDGGVSALFADQNIGLYGSELELESMAFMAKWNSRLSKAWNLTAYGKYQTMRNDNVNIDVNDAGATARYGLTPGFYDFTRRSGYDLDIISTGFDVAWKAAHGVTISGGYEFHQEDRKNYLDHNVPETTDKHTFKLKGDWRVNNKIKLGLSYKLDLIDDPYALYNAVCPSSGSLGTYAGPATPWGTLTQANNINRTYDKNIYSKRIGTRSNQPESVNELSFRANFIPIQTMMANLYSKYRYAENSDLGGNDWQQNLYNIGMNVVVTPTQKFTLTAGYDYFYDTIDAMYCIAIYDG